ncbi:MAG TPA: TetR/AcrR family transcriptional regulator [Baekduia sp.]|nr:TetR/AcrR family transcriptional regulator [Baekduia sp.]
MSDRRTEVLDHARHVIMRDGLGTTSLRRISREGGYTTGVLSYYFADKRELLAACFDWTHRTWLDHAEGKLAEAASPEESLRTYVDIAIPRDEERQREWRLWLEFCVAAVGDPELAGQLLRHDSRWSALTAKTFERWQQAGLVDGTLAPDEQGATLIQLADGLGLRAILTGDWDDARRRFVATLRLLGVSEALAAAALATPDATEAT